METKQIFALRVLLGIFRMPKTNASVKNAQWVTLPILWRKTATLHLIDVSHVIGESMEL